MHSKRAKIIASIANYEKKLAQAWVDLNHITAAIVIFEASGGIEEIPPHTFTDTSSAVKLWPDASPCRAWLAQYLPAGIEGDGREGP